MHAIDLLNGDVAELPKAWAGGDFPKFLAGAFDQFRAECAKLKALDRISQDYIKVVPLMSSLCDLVLQAMGEYFQGFPHRAYTTIDRAIQSAQPHFDRLCSPHDLSASLKFLYRARTGSAVPLTKGQLFHIPFDERDKVGPQRYSVPGLPCLYLGGSLYICWEELQRPDLHRLHVSRFAAVDNAGLRVLDFGYRPALMAAMIADNLATINAGGSLADFALAYGVCWPLLAACSIRVKERDEPFKPEYVIPHLILQWITNTKKLDGVRYFSVNLDKYYNDPMACANFVFPVQSSAPAGYCTRLRKAFEMSEPVPWQLGTGLQIPAGFPPHCNWEIELIKGVKARYINTEFGQMQARMVNLPIGAV